MSTTNRKYPYEDTKIAELIRDKINELATVKSQRQIAAEIGFDMPNALSMYKRGESKVPLARLPAFARALDIDLGMLFRSGLAQWWPGEEHAIAQMVEERVVTTSERAGLRLLRTYLQDDDPRVSADLLEQLHRRFRD